MGCQEMVPVIVGVSFVRARQQDRSRYLFKRRGSENWYVRLQPPGQKLVERSLGTPDKAAAELAAADLVKQHRAFMYQRRQARVSRIVHGPWLHEHKPGLHTLPDGGHVLATETTLTFIDAAGKIRSTKPNGGPAIYLTGAPLSAAQTFKALDDAWDDKIGEGPIESERQKLVAAKSSPDDALLETYVEDAALSKTREAQAREMWRIFRTVVDKPLAKCTREDGKAIVKHIKATSDKPLKSATLRRYMVPLVAIVTLAIKDSKHDGVNPFVSVVPDQDDADERAAFSEEDIKLIRANLHRLSENDQLLVRILATTGMRRGEAFEIASEKTDNGIRYCEIGTKTDASHRRVPFPKDLLPYLPAKITKPVLTGRKDNATKRLRKWLSDIGIHVADKAPAHSFRHRAAKRMRDASIAEDVREAIGGWANGKGKKTGRKYGNKNLEGYAITILRKAIDKIGM
jgi:integrase